MPQGRTEDVCGVGERGGPAVAHVGQRVRQEQEG
jgi:hypothetical protein